MLRDHVPILHHAFALHKVSCGLCSVAFLELEGRKHSLDGGALPDQPAKLLLLLLCLVSIASQFAIRN